MLLNVVSGLINYIEVTKMRHLYIIRPGLIKTSVLLIWFEDIALAEFCEIIIPAIFAILVAFMFYICPNREYFILFKRENFDFDNLVQTEISLVCYIAIETLSFTAKRYYIHKAFSIDIFKLLHFSLSKNGITFGSVILSSFMYTVFTELDHVRNDWSIEVAKECVATVSV